MDKDYNFLDIVKTNNYQFDVPFFSPANLKNIFSMLDGKTVKRGRRGIDMCLETQSVLDDYYFFFNRILRFIRVVPIPAKKDEAIILQKKDPFPNDGTPKVDPEGWAREFGDDDSIYSDH